MKTLFLAAAALIVVPGAAQAQLLGGAGGVGGTLGGTVGGVMNGGPIGTSIDRTTQTLRGTARGSARTRGNQSVDARKGRASADRSVEGDLAASTDQLTQTPIAPLASSASASGEAQGNGQAQAQLIGTDAVTNTARNAVSTGRTTAQNAAGQAREQVSSLAGSVPAAPGAGSLSGSGSGSGAASGNLMTAPLAAAGSAAAAGEGAFAVSPGMPVIAPDGATLGRVREVVADSRGRVQQVVVEAGKVRRTIPAGALSASGDALVAGEASGNAAAN